MHPNASPLISVVMAVKNGGNLVGEAIESILKQTYTDFEFIIINDGSTDNTLETIGRFHDPRIRSISQENQGLSKSLNCGIRLSRGRFIARQDHDDLSLPKRLEKQLAYLEAHPNCGLLGTAAEIWTLEGPTGRFHDHPCESAVLAFDLLFNNPFVHTSWMFRKAVVDRIGYYTTDCLREPPEDYEYISRVVREFDVANLPDRLVIYREMQNSMSSLIRPQNRLPNNPFSERLALISSENIAHVTQQKLSNNDVVNFGALSHGYSKGFSPAGTYSGVRHLLVLATHEIQLRYPQSLLNPLLVERINSLFNQYAYQEFLLSQERAGVGRFFHYCAYRLKIILRKLLKCFLGFVHKILD